MTELWSTILRLRSVLSGLAWKPSSSLLIVHLSLFTVTLLYVTQLTRTPSAQRSVHQVAEEDVTSVIWWLMTCTSWPRAHSTWLKRNKKKRAMNIWKRVVCSGRIFMYLRSQWIPWPWIYSLDKILAGVSLLKSKYHEQFKADFAKT